MCPFICNPPTTYTSITGTAGPTGDDAGIAVPIGFTFQYKSQTYTQVWMCTNGFIQLGATGSTAYVNDLASTTITNMVAGFWDDLIASAGQIQYTTTGTAPNRIFIVQFTNVPFLASSSNT